LRQILIFLQDHSFLFVVRNIDNKFKHLVICSKDVEFAFLLIPHIRVRWLESEFLGVVGVLVVFFQDSHHFLDLAFRDIQNTEPGSVGLHTDDIVALLLRLEKWTKHFTEIRPDSF